MPPFWVPHDYQNHVYASNLSCVQNTDLMTCEEQQNKLQSSNGSGATHENKVDGTSASNNENDEIPLIIPNISPTLDENDDDDGDDGLGQENSEDGSDGANSEEENARASNGNDDLEISAPSVLPFP